MDYVTMQKIARGVLESSAACDGQLFTGTVTSANPLKIKLGEESGSIEIDGDDIILTQSVVSKKIYIEKHNHSEEAALIDHKGTGNLGAPILFTPLGVELYVNNPDYDPNKPRTDTDEAPGTPDNPMKILNPAIPDPTTLPMEHTHSINTTVVNGWATEYGHRLPVDKDDERIIITINRGLEDGDKVVMTRVSGGQQFVVLSRYFEVDKQGEDDE